MRDYPILHLKQNKVNEHERLSNITLKTNCSFTLIYVSSVILDSLSCSFTLFCFKCNIG
jgi:hypothetical protein